MPVDFNILPPTLRTPEFEALWQLAWETTLGLDPSVILWQYIDTVDSTLLPHLIDQFAVSGYRGGFLADTDEKKRSLVKNAIELHQRSGTFWAVQKALESVGFRGVQIEQNPRLTYDGSWVYNGEEVHSGKRWARFVLKFSTNPPSNKLELIRELVRAWKPARSHLLELPTVLTYDGSWVYDGSQNYDGYK